MIMILEKEKKTLKKTGLQYSERDRERPRETRFQPESIYTYTIYPIALILFSFFFDLVV